MRDRQQGTAKGLKLQLWFKMNLQTQMSFTCCCKSNWTTRKCPQHGAKGHLFWGLLLVSFFVIVVVSSPYFALKQPRFWSLIFSPTIYFYWDKSEYIENQNVKKSKSNGKFLLRSSLWERRELSHVWLPYLFCSGGAQIMEPRTRNQEPLEQRLHFNC